MNGEWIIYHNPRCSKSRETLALLEAKGITPTVVEYLKQPLDVEALKRLKSALGYPAKALLRTKEAVWKELDLDENDESTVLKAIGAHPVLMERPIVVCGDRAVIGRPPENIAKLF